MTRDEYAVRVSAGLCAWSGCADQHQPGRVHCGKHAERNRRTTARVYLRRAGRCRRCGGELAERSGLACEEHLQDQREYMRRWRAKQAAA